MAKPRLFLTSWAPVTSCAFVLEVVGCPLLLLWPFVCEMPSSQKRKSKKEPREELQEVEEHMMEMRLRESPEKFSTALLQLGLKYLFVLGTQVGAEVGWLWGKLSWCAVGAVGHCVERKGSARAQTGPGVIMSGCRRKSSCTGPLLSRAICSVLWEGLQHRSCSRD